MAGRNALYPDKVFPLEHVNLLPKNYVYANPILGYILILSGNLDVEELINEPGFLKIFRFYQKNGMDLSTVFKIHEK